jgi:hypothetical protein
MNLEDLLTLKDDFEAPKKGIGEQIRELFSEFKTALS